MKIGQVFVSAIQANRMGDRSEKARITASYQIAGVMGSIEFDVPIADARAYWVGQVLRLSVDTDQEGAQG